MMGLDGFQIMILWVGFYLVLCALAIVLGIFLLTYVIWEALESTTGIRWTRIIMAWLFVLLIQFHFGLRA